MWEVVEHGVPTEPANVDPTRRQTMEETSLKDLMVLQLLQTAVSDQIFTRIAPATTYKIAWDALETDFQGSPQVRLIKLQSLRREHENLKMNKGDNIKVLTGKLFDLGNQLRVHGEEKADYQIIQKLLAPRLELEETAQTHEACFYASDEPQLYDEASEIKVWRDAMKEEMKMIEKNKTWLLVDKTEKKNIISVKWIYHIKSDANGNLTKYKARLVERGFSQAYGIDYFETFSPV